MSLHQRRIVVVNDDGIEARGLSILESAARRCSEEVWVVAPHSNQSGSGRALTWGGEVQVEKRGTKRFAVHGTPADCVLVALNGLLGGRSVDLVVSGVNDGVNLADDIGTSGTVGACLEAAEQGVPGIAFSQSRGGFLPTCWSCAEGVTAALLPRLFDALCAPRRVLNVNYPAVADTAALAGLAVTHSGWRAAPTRIEERGRTEGRRVFRIADDLREERPNEPGCDLDLAARGYVTVTPLTLDQTRHDDLAPMRARLGDALVRGSSPTRRHP